MFDPLPYAAYGSNLDPDRIRQPDRAPGAKLIGPGILMGWRLRLNRFATIERHDREFVPVVIWQLSAPELCRLDLREGYAEGRAPQTETTAGNSYDRLRVAARLQDGRDVECWTYVEVSTRSSRFQPAEDTYLAHLRNGYAYFGLDESKLDAAIVLGPMRTL